MEFRGGAHENEFWLFSYAKNNFTNSEKVYEKDGVTCPVCMWLLPAIVLKLSKIVFFLQFYADSSKKSRSVIAIYV